MSAHFYIEEMEGSTHLRWANPNHVQMYFDEVSAADGLHYTLDTTSRYVEITGSIFVKLYVGVSRHTITKERLEKLQSMVLWFNGKSYFFDSIETNIADYIYDQSELEISYVFKRGAR